MKCLDCKFYDKNDYVHGYGTCEPQDEDFKCDHDCNLSEKEYKEIENMINEIKIELHKGRSLSI